MEHGKHEKMGKKGSMPKDKHMMSEAEMKKMMTKDKKMMKSGHMMGGMEA